VVYGEGTTTFSKKYRGTFVRKFLALTYRGMLNMALGILGYGGESFT
jgi:hypothetical protein